LSNLIQDEVLNLSIRLEDAEKTSLNTDKALASANQAVSRLEAQLSEALTEIKALRGEVDSLRTKGAAQPTAAVSTTDQAIAVLKRLGAKVVLSFDP
jgi:chromosome segregation ATPase